MLAVYNKANYSDQLSVFIGRGPYAYSAVQYKAAQTAVSH